MGNTAADIILKGWDNQLRVVCLYVGQGSATLAVVPTDGDSPIFMLIDMNMDYKAGGVDVPRLLSDVLPAAGETDPRRHLDVFVNTHPHKDHLAGLPKLKEVVRVGNVWHSGHQPGRDHDDAYQDLMDLCDEVERRGGDVRELTGTREYEQVGACLINVLAPAEYVKDDIEGEDADTRYQRIHEHCVVLRLVRGEGGGAVLITGDADRPAWENCITDYHGKGDDNRIAAPGLIAAHHGSRTFFMKSEGDEDIYTEALETIDPSLIVVSAPTQKESKHGHPHDDAMQLYEDHLTSKSIGVEGLRHLGEGRKCIFIDMDVNGEMSAWSDEGELAEEYGLSDDGPDNGGDDRSGPPGDKSGTPRMIRASRPVPV